MFGPMIYYGALFALFIASVMCIYLELEVSKRKLAQWINETSDTKKKKLLLKEIVDDHNEIIR